MTRAGAGFMAVTVLAGVTLTLSARAGDWPQLLGPQRNGVSAETGLLPSWPKAGPPLRWEKEVGSGFSGPAVAGDRLVLFHRIGDEEVVASLEAATGKEQWKFSYSTSYIDQFNSDDGPRATPVIAGDRVYTLGAEGRLHCLELQSGRKIWERSLSADYSIPKSFFGVGASPLVEGNLLLVNVGGKDAGMVAFDKDTGKEVWKATSHEGSYSSPVAATLAGVRQAVFFTREGIVFLDPQTGKVNYSKHWRSNNNASVNAACPVIVEDSVFLSACYNTGAILLHVHKDHVEEIWKSDEVMSNHYNTCVAYQGHLYGCDGRQEQTARLRCVDMKTGKVAWTEEGFGCATAVLAEGNLILLSENGDLVLVQATPDAYKEKARAKVLGKPSRSPIALANGFLYARDAKKLGCWNLQK